VPCQIYFIPLLVEAMLPGTLMCPILAFYQGDFYRGAADKAFSRFAGYLSFIDRKRGEFVGILPEVMIPRAEGL
jgi:hypothetical protein